MNGVHASRSVRTPPSFETIARRRSAVRTVCLRSLRMRAIGGRCLISPHPEGLPKAIVSKDEGVLVDVCAVYFTRHM